MLSNDTTRATRVTSSFLLYLVVALSAAGEARADRPDDFSVEELDEARRLMTIAESDADEVSDAPAEAAEPAVSTPMITLPDAIALAMDRSPQIRAADHEVDAAEWRIEEATWSWTPKFDAKSIFTVLPDTSARDPYNVNDSAVDIEIFSKNDGYGVWTRTTVEALLPLSLQMLTAYELAEVGVDVAELRRQEAQYQVTFDVARAYYGLQVAKALQVVIDDAESQLRRARKSFDRFLEKDDDAVDEVDGYRLDIAREALNAQIVDAKNALILTEKGLRVHTLLEGPFNIPKMRFKPDNVTLRPVEEVVALGLKLRPDLNMLDRALQAQGLKVELETVKWAPDFFIAASFSQAYSGAVPESKLFYDSDPFNGLGIGGLIGLRWKIDPVNRAIIVEREDSKLAQLQSQRELARRGAALETEKAWRDTQATLDKVEFARKGRRAAKRWMAQAFLDYETGGGKINDLINAVSQYGALRTAYLLALNDFRVALMRLQLTSGAASVNDLLSEGTLEDFDVDVEDGGDDD